MSVAPVSSGSNAGASNQASSSTTSASAAPDVTKTMFMQLLVAQLKNQDPLNPSDPTQFVTELAQFQQLEQALNSGQEMLAARKDLDQLVAALGKGTASKS